MPLTHTRTFRLRRHECDAEGALQPASYLRLMQETAFDASAEAGYDSKRYEQIGHTWLIRETFIELFHPLVYDDVVNIKTWVADFVRVRSRRAYEFTLAGSGILAAKAFTDWVFLNTETLRPAVVPKEMQNAFYPEGVPDTFPPRDKFNKISAQPDDAHTGSFQVQWRDIDQMHHLNNAAYLSYLDETRIQSLTANIQPHEVLQHDNKRFSAQNYRIEYLQPIMYGDTIEITTWAESGMQKNIRHYIITKMGDNAVLARAKTQH